jgi:hypothetical protein
VQSVLTCPRGRIDCRSEIERTTPTIGRIRVLLNSVVASPILKIGLGFILQFLRFLGASSVPLNFINRLVNTELDTLDFGEEFMALQGSAFWVYSFPFYFIMKMFNIKLMCY